MTASAAAKGEKLKKCLYPAAVVALLVLSLGMTALPAATEINTGAVPH